MLERRGRWLAALAVAVIAWRVAAFSYPRPEMTDSLALHGALMMVGLWHLMCGLWAFHRAPGRASFLFALFGITGALHWGGPLVLGHAGLDLFLLGFYLVASSVLGQTLFLHVALAYPPAVRARRMIALLYLPTLLGAMAIGPLSVLGASEGAGAALAQGLQVLLLVATILAVGGVVVWVVRLVRGRDRVSLAMVVGAIAVDVMTQGTSMAGFTLGGWTQLGYAAVPTALALALVRVRAPERAREPLAAAPR